MAIKPGPKSKARELDLSWRSGDLAEDRIEFMRRFCGVALYPWQREEVRRVGGQTRPRVSYTQIPRKNGKSLLAAALALTELVLLEDRHIYAISDSERNLNSVLVREMRQLLQRSEDLADAVYVFKWGMECPQSASFFEVRAGNFRASQGINPHAVFFDEVHLQRSDEIWAGMQMAGAAREDFMLYGITTPGFDPTSLAHSLYEEVKAGSPLISGVIYEPDNPECHIDDEEAARQANPCYDLPGFRGALDYDRATLPAHQYRCFRLGQWGWQYAEHAIPLEKWDAAKGTPELPDGSRIFLGVDAAISRDSSAVAVIGKDDAGKLHSKVYIFSATETGMDFAAIENTIRDLATNYEVAECAYDPFAFTRSAQVLEEEGIPMVQVRQDVSNMVPASQALYDAVTNGLLVHDGDSLLRQHIEAAVSQQTERGWRLSKRKSRAPIDAAIALALAVWRANLAPEVFAAPRFSIV